MALYASRGDMDEARANLADFFVVKPTLSARRAYRKWRFAWSDSRVALTMRDFSDGHLIEPDWPH